MEQREQKLFVFVGSYAEADKYGLQVYECNEQTGALTLRSEYGGLVNPTFLNVDAERKLLYAITEAVNADGAKIGAAAAFRIDASQGTLEELNRRTNVDSTTCHIQRDAAGRYLTVTSYHGGYIGLLAIEASGEVGPVLDVQQHVGSGPNAGRQEKAHPHSSFYSPDGRFLFVQDLGIDRIVAYRIDEAAGTLVKHGETVQPPGSGPRHLAFHPGGRFAYVINELTGTVTAFRYDADSGRLEPLQTISTLPEGFEGDNICAEITVSPDGRTLYGSNRGHDSLVVYAIDEATGLLRTLQHISSGGGHPRHFALTPRGDYLLAANRDANGIAIFAVDARDGTLSQLEGGAHSSRPVCVVPVYLTL